VFALRTHNCTRWLGPSLKPCKQVALDLRKLDPVLFHRELLQAEKDNADANARTPFSERDEEDRAEGYIKMSKLRC